LTARRVSIEKSQKLLRELPSLGLVSGALSRLSFRLLASETTPRLRISYRGKWQYFMTIKHTCRVCSFLLLGESTPESRSRGRDFERFPSEGGREYEVFLGLLSSVSKARHRALH
jgi:hypothetical protein